jgi:hypothetical protein
LRIKVHRDCGKEFADNRRFTLATNIEVYFCDPQSPWQRGSKFEKGPVLARSGQSIGRRSDILFRPARPLASFDQPDKKLRQTGRHVSTCKMEERASRGTSCHDKSLATKPKSR